MTFKFKTKLFLSYNKFKNQFQQRMDTSTSYPTPTQF